MYSVAKTALLSLNDTRKRLDSKEGFLIMHKPIDNLRDEVEVHFASCRFAITDYKELLGVNPDGKLDESQMKLYHYDSFEEIEVDYPNAIFSNIRRRFR